MSRFTKYKCNICNMVIPEEYTGEHFDDIHESLLFNGYTFNQLVEELI